MPRVIKAAAVQMNAAPAPTPERLERAARLVADAAAAGAQIVVLPELFNSGYEYSEANYTRAEPMDSLTVQWMKAQAAQHGVHLAGTLLLLDDEDIYNAALLVAPDGRTWRYDKNHPFLWERAYFREGDRITVAETDLGRFGLLICFDYLQPTMWERYAGRVDAMLMMSCPPRVMALDFLFPDGLRLNTVQLGPVMNALQPPDLHPFGGDLDQRAAWLRVPLIHASAGGNFRSHLPNARLSLATFLAGRPDLWDRLAEADAVVVEAGYDRETKILDVAGNVIARVETSEDGFVIGDITIAGERPQPGYDHPAPYLHPIISLLSDVIGPAAMTGQYRRGVRQQFGARMAPVSARTKTWLGAVVVAALVGWIVGRRV